MKNSEQPAFPLAFDDTLRLMVGLTKREYFAALAMQGILSHPVHYMAHNTTELAKEAVNCADFLLKQLET